jgi:hypothetical protein
MDKVTLGQVFFEYSKTPIIRHSIIRQVLSTFMAASHSVWEVQKERRMRSLSRDV